jgi:uncharacterized repeat protein (TIGR03847 family)
MTPIDFGDVDAFTAGAIGQPGERVFYLQARRGASAASVRCEKSQVAVLGQYLEKVLATLPPTPAPGADDTVGLSEPVNPMFILGEIGVAIDTDDDRIVLQLEEIREVPDDDDAAAASDEEDDDDEDDRAALRVSLTREQASAFCRHAAAVVAAGRPACRWCGRPMDRDGHPCPAMN